MAFELKQSLRLSQQLVMTPQLQQAIKLLQLNRQELQEMINQELVENPVLEEAGDEVSPTPPEEVTHTDMAAGERGEGVAEAGEGVPDAPSTEREGEERDWEGYLEEYSNYQKAAPVVREAFDDLPTYENALTKTTTLADHLSWQLSMTNLAPNELEFGKLVIGNLSDDGYLVAPFEELAKEAGMELEDAEEALTIIKGFDPVGVGSRDLRECLLTQAKLLPARDELVEKLIANHLPDLERKNYAALSKMINVPIEKIVEATKVIMEFEPKPGRSFVTGDTHYILPDIYVVRVADEFVIMLNEDGLPKLRVSPYYKQILGEMKGDQKATKEFVQEKLRSALWLIRSIHNRQKTIYKVTDAIVKRQRDFFLKGVQFLKPMILRDVAADIGMHESTISRVTTNKYVHTPVGLFELKYFFNSSIGTSDGSDAVASEAVKEKIKTLVSKEDPRHPISDQKIVQLLTKENVVIARRTVAKYREMLGILPSARRKKVF